MGYLVCDLKDNGGGFLKAFSNRRQVSEYTEISYSTLTNHFVRDRRVWHRYEEKGIMIINYPDPEKGRQRVHRKGVGHDRNI